MLSEWMHIEEKISTSPIENLDFHLNAATLSERMYIEVKISISSIDYLDFHLNAETLSERMRIEVKITISPIDKDMLTEHCSVNGCTLRWKSPFHPLTI